MANAASAASLPADTPRAILEFFAHWRSLPRRGLVPTLSDYLDHAPPRLQPFVAIADAHAPDNIVLRLVGTGIVHMMGIEITGAKVDAIYAANLRKLMSTVLWEAASRPVGYLCRRSIHTRFGRIVHAPSIILPLANPPSPVPAVMSYNHIADAETSLPTQDHLEYILDFGITHWIDIGAGVPGGEDDAGRTDTPR